MHKRCKDPKTNGYKSYGAKGITVDERWSSYENFIEDVGPRPTPKHQLDRIDNTLGYFKGNCRWVTASENVRNSSVIRMIEWGGETKPLSEWASQLGLACSTFARRLDVWSLEKAMTFPHGPTGPKRKQESIIVD